MYEGKHIHFSEVDNKPLCSYSPKLCKQRRLNGYAFCIRHVLEDRTAPFKQCEYVAKYNSQRCTNPIPKAEDRRYCNSHLQVLGFIPKKERKKKNDQIEDLRTRHQMDSVALSLSMPTLTLKMPNGLDRPALSPPLARLPIHYLEMDLEDPFAFNEEEDDLKKGVAVKKKLQSKLVQNQQRLKEAEVIKLNLEHFRQPSAPSQQPQQTPQPPLLLPQASQLPPLQQLNTHPPCLTSPSKAAGLSQVIDSKPSQPQNTSQPTQGSCHVTQTVAHVSQSPSKKTPLPHPSSPLLLHPPAAVADSSKPEKVVIKAANYTRHSTCVSRLQKLLKLCLQRQQLNCDLFPHLGLDWSEDSSEELDDAERVPPFQNSWPLQEAYLHDRNDSEDEARNSRVNRLCTYLQQKYKHLCHLERAECRQKRCRHAFRKALLQAASREPECAGELIQKLKMVKDVHPSVRHPESREMNSTSCITGTARCQQCSRKALPFTRHCFQHILLNRSQQLFSSCTAKFADGQQCSVPVFDITHQTPLCEEHAKKMDNFLRGDNSRKIQHQQQRKPRKKTKPPALTKKHKKRRRKGPHRPQKPIPPALPQGNLCMPSSLTLSVKTSIISHRSPSTPDLSTDELPDDITTDIADIPNDLELNHEDFSDVLPRLPDDLQDFDFFEGKNGELLPTTEEAEELERALQAVTSYTASLECLSTMADLTQSDSVAVEELSDREMGVFSTATSAASIQSLSQEVNNELGELLNGRISTENFSSLELDENLLHPSTLSSTSVPLAGQIQGHFPPPVSVSLTSANRITQSTLDERTFSAQFHGLHDGSHTSQRTHSAQLLGKAEDLLNSHQQYSSNHSSPHGSQYSSEHVPSPYSDQITSPHGTSYSGDSLAATFTSEVPLMAQHIIPSQLEGTLSGVVNSRTPWGSLPVNLSDSASFNNLIEAEGHLLSTSLSTPPSTSHSETVQPTFVKVTSNNCSVHPSQPQQSFSSAILETAVPSDIAASSSSKQQPLPQFNATFGPQLTSHTGIPKDLQPPLSSVAPVTGLTVAGVTTTDSCSVSASFTTQS
ncbi:INO80 complex subunit D [Protopterus annectens]|uniref:INO80 complex subunit D n=1 Tax=Protopterus annectens TaxID=7888 RepID=UPI001CFA8881|nr:INO80 complex subunit D [Protopterus annectens]